MTRAEKNRKTRKKTVSYRIRRALRLIRKHRPATIEDAERIGLGLVEIGQGAFRTTYSICGTPLLIKFPISYRDISKESDGGPEVWTCKDGKQHTRSEARRTKILRQFRALRNHIPPIYYFNSQDGVIVTKMFEQRTGMEIAKISLISKLIKTFCGVTLGDMTPDNLRTEKGNLVVIDLGY